MIQIDDKLISFDVFEKHFCCDLPQCLGACCVHGLSGAPLEPEEIDILKKEIGIIEQFLKPGGIEAVRKQMWPSGISTGIWLLLIEERSAHSALRRMALPCVPSRRRGYREGRVLLSISCHLYPIRVKIRHSAINYDQWSICQPARDLGLKNGILVYKF